jgi:hypothetical protein
MLHEKRKHLAERVVRHRLRRQVRAAMQREWERDHVRVTETSEPLGVAGIPGHYTCERWARWPKWLPFGGHRFERQCGKPARVSVEILYRSDDLDGVPFRYCKRHGRRDVARQRNLP